MGEEFYGNVAELYGIDLTCIERQKANLDPAQAGEEVEGYNAVHIKNAGKLKDLPSGVTPPAFVAME
ncbi:MAG: hypothetical protein U5K56_04445 [Halioglobus sp.]|nr:hypothetical protein [Halioglobus sp.]